MNCSECGASLLYKSDVYWNETICPEQPLCWSCHADQKIEVDVSYAEYLMDTANKLKDSRKDYK